MAVAIGLLRKGSSAMGKRYSRSKRRRLANQTRKSRIETVAASAGVKPETVMKWRNEFGVTGGPAVGPALGPNEFAGPSLETDPNGDENRSELSESEREDLIDEFGSVMGHATVAYAKERREWLEDEAQWQEDAIAIRQLIDDWQSEHGQLTKREKREARARLRR